MSPRRARDEAGFGLIEVAIGVALLALVVSTTTFVFSQTTKSINNARIRTVAQRLAVAAVENADSFQCGLWVGDAQSEPADLLDTAQTVCKGIDGVTPPAATRTLGDSQYVPTEAATGVNEDNFYRVTVENRWVTEVSGSAIPASGAGGICGNPAGFSTSAPTGLQRIVSVETRQNSQGTGVDRDGEQRTGNRTFSISQFVSIPPDAPIYGDQTRKGIVVVNGTSDQRALGVRIAGSSYVDYRSLKPGECAWFPYLPATTASIVNESGATVGAPVTLSSLCVIRNVFRTVS
jgi:type II secretory pathway pseudopilin PulG